MPSVQYRRDHIKKAKSLYSSGQKREFCRTCPSSCSCKLGERSSFDRMAYQNYIKNLNAEQ